MTRFERFTADIESIADLVIMATNLDLGQQYCKNLPECDDIPDSKCRECLIEWLNEDLDGDTQ